MRKGILIGIFSIILVTGSSANYTSATIADQNISDTVTINQTISWPFRYHPSFFGEGWEPVPEEALEVDVSSPDHVIGTGTPESVTEEAFIEAVAQGGIIIFDAGEDPFILELSQTAKVFNDKNPDVVIDGGGIVTLSGGNNNRILYMNTCDPDQNWTTSHCQNQDHPRLVVQNINFANGNAENDKDYPGGGAIFVRGGRFKMINCAFINNRAAMTGPDVGGGAVRVLSQYNNYPVYVVNCIFGGVEGYGNVAANGGAIGSIGVSWTIINSVFSYNEAVGYGGNPAVFGTPGGGSGGAIYNDGNTMTLDLRGTVIEHNKVNAYGSGIFFVSNDHSGQVKLHNTILADNEGGSWYPVIPDLSMHDDTRLSITTKEHAEHSHEKPIVANPTWTPVLVDDVEVAFESYNIADNNYFKLRDIAAILSGTGKQFEITWDDATHQIELIQGMQYTRVGGELIAPDTGVQICQISTPKLKMNQLNISLTTYLIHDNNFVKLRDLGELLDFGVEWDSVNQQVLIHSDEGYHEEGNGHHEDNADHDHDHDTDQNLDHDHDTEQDHDHNR